MATKVIVIDDSRTVREQLSDVLAAAGHSIVEAADGLAGAEAVNANPDAPRAHALHVE